MGGWVAGAAENKTNLALIKFELRERVFKGFSRLSQGFLKGVPRISYICSVKKAKLGRELNKL